MVKNERVGVDQAFEIYFAQGASRSLSNLHKHLTEIAPAGQKPVSVRTLKEWSRKNNWQQRCVIKDKAVAEGIEKKTTKSAIERKARWLSRIEGRIDSAFDEDGKPLFPVEEWKDLNETIKLALVLIGESEKQDVEHRGEIKIIRIKSNDERDDRDSEQ